MDDIEQLNQRHPIWKGTPVHIIGAAYRNGVVERCYLVKLNGRKNAWAGWVPVAQIQQKGGTESLQRPASSTHVSH